MAEVDKAMAVGLESRAWSPCCATSRLPHLQLNLLQQAFTLTKGLSVEHERAFAEFRRVFGLLQEATPVFLAKVRRLEAERATALTLAEQSKAACQVLEKEVDVLQAKVMLVEQDSMASREKMKGLANASEVKNTAIEQDYMVLKMNIEELVEAGVEEAKNHHKSFEALKARVQELEVQKAAAEARLKEYEENLGEELVALEATFEAKVMELENDNMALKARIKGLVEATAVLEEPESYQKNLEVLEAKVQELEAEKRAAELRLKQYDNSEQALEATFKAKLMELEQANTALKTKLQRLEEANITLEGAVDAPKASQPVVPPLNHVEARHAEEQMTESLFHSTKDLLTLLHDLEEHKAAAEYGDTEAAEKQSQMAVLATAKLEALRQESASYEIKRLTAELHSSREELLSSREEKKGLEAQLQQLEQSVRDLADSEARLTRVQNNETGSEELCQQLTEDLAAARQAKTLLERQVDILTERLQSTDDTLNCLSGRLKDPDSKDWHQRTSASSSASSSSLFNARVLRQELRGCKDHIQVLEDHVKVQERTIRRLESIRTSSSP
uniref:Uncharacterized protein n=1 Tax=Eutreptiella gymnastica TaxID=73025 RepID=A0A7S1N156_9EUGL